MDERSDLVRQLTRSGEAGDVDLEWWNHRELLRADLALAQRRIDEARHGYQAASADPQVAPYARNVLQQMTESLGDGAR
jgi:predicted negative regulator of RcsB-dependent stress response